MVPEQELVIYRVAQEALTNIARHAEAEGVSVSLRREAVQIVLEVRDDGRGLPDGAERSSPEWSTGPTVIVVLLASVASRSAEIITSAVLVLLFVLITSPLSTHAVARAARRRPRRQRE